MLVLISQDFEFTIVSKYSDIAINLTMSKLSWGCINHKDIVEKLPFLVNVTVLLLIQKSKKWHNFRRNILRGFVMIFKKKIRIK